MGSLDGARGKAGLCLGVEGCFAIKAKAGEVEGRGCLGTFLLCHLSQGRRSGTHACTWSSGMRLPFPHLSKELPTRWWWAPWPSWTSAWHSCSSQSSPTWGTCLASSGFGRALPPLTCLFSLFFPGCFFCLSLLLPFLSVPLVLSLAFSFSLSLQILSFPLALSLSFPLPFLPNPSLSRLFTYEGLFLAQSLSLL